MNFKNDGAKWGVYNYYNANFQVHDRKILGTRDCGFVLETLLNELKPKTKIINIKRKEAFHGMSNHSVLLFWHTKENNKVKRKRRINIC